LNVKRIHHLKLTRPTEYDVLIFQVLGKGRDFQMKEGTSKALCFTEKAAKSSLRKLFKHSKTLFLQHEHLVYAFH